jgi:hypothetical protein
MEACTSSGSSPFGIVVGTNDFFESLRGLFPGELRQPEHGTLPRIGVETLVPCHLQELRPDHHVRGQGSGPDRFVTMIAIDPARQREQVVGCVACANRSEIRARCVTGLARPPDPHVEIHDP